MRPVRVETSIEVERDGREVEALLVGTYTPAQAPCSAEQLAAWQNGRGVGPDDGSEAEAELLSSSVPLSEAETALAVEALLDAGCDS